MKRFLTFSSGDKGFPISGHENCATATDPSHEHAIIMVPHDDHAKSITEFVNKSLITTRGRFKLVDQIDTDLSREPNATQQCLIRLLSFCIMFPLNF